MNDDVEQTPVIIEIVTAVATEHGVSVLEILGRSHAHPIAKARHEVWRRVRAATDMSYPQIGKRFGVDHSTVVSALRGRRASQKERAK